MVESAWAYRYKPVVGASLRKRQKSLSSEVCEVSWKAQKRLCGKFCKMRARGKEPQTVVVAVGRELLGFIWDIGVRLERAAEAGNRTEGAR